MNNLRKNRIPGGFSDYRNLNRDEKNVLLKVEKDVKTLFKT